MTGQVQAGAASFVAGGALAGAQVVSASPWQAGFALGVLLLIVGLCAIADGTSGFVDEDAERADNDLWDFDREEREFDRMGDRVPVEEIAYLPWPRSVWE